MKPEIKKLWTDALRSGEYRQTQLLLHCGDSFCCLGVLCDLAIKQGLGLDKNQIGDPTSDSDRFAYDGFDSTLPPRVLEWAGLDRDVPSPGQSGWDCDAEGSPVPFGKEGRDLATLNDTGTSFQDIADVIDEHF